MFARLVPIFPTTHDLASLDEDFAGLDLNQRKSYLDPSSFDQLQLPTNIDLSLVNRLIQMMSHLIKTHPHEDHIYKKIGDIRLIIHLRK